MDVTGIFADREYHHEFTSDPPVHTDADQSTVTSGFRQAASQISSIQALGSCERLKRAAYSSDALAAPNLIQHATPPIHQSLQQGHTPFVPVANPPIPPDTAMNISVVQPHAGLNPVGDRLERCKEEIQILYLHERDTLEVVRRKLNTKYHLKASSKMYKDRIAKWGFKKNIKDVEKAAIVRKQTQRSHAGRRSEIQFRNTPNLPSRLSRYLKEKNVRAYRQALVLRAPTPPDLICRTPPPNRPLRMPRELESPELVALVIQEHVRGMLESGVWQLTDTDVTLTLNNRKTTGEHLLASFAQGCLSALDGLQREDYIDAFKWLNVSMSMADDILRNQYPSTWTSICYFLGHLVRSKRGRSMVDLMLKHFAAISAVFLARDHPFRILFDSLLHTNGVTTEHILAMGVNVASDMFADRFGKFNRVSLTTQRYTVRWIRDLNKTIDVYSNLAHELRATLGPDDGRYWSTCNHLAEGFLSATKYQKAADVAESVIERIAAAAYFTYWHSDALDILARAQTALCKTALAERNLRKAICVSAQIRGWGNALTLRLMSRLRCWLRDWGRAEAAASIQTELEEILKTTLEKHRLEEEERFQRHGITDASVC